MSGLVRLSLRKDILPKGARAEVVFAAAVVAMVLAMILPLPVWLLDGLLAVNISSAALLMVLVVQVQGTVGLSTFPTLLLMSTLMRLALEVATTRLILLEANAGHIIDAFAEVVVGGNLVVGFVVFAILTLVQFLVITKGAERVAEVSARFSLDAMPGKQMAIDMELRSNAITSDQARAQRALLAQESQFFGAMDGAMKFVKGDAIAGIVIMVVNLLGGLGIGILQRGLPAGEAMRIYSLLTIGDGLVAQVPALLNALTAGLLVTKSGGADAGSIGGKLTQQILAYPKAWMTCGLLVIAFGLVPGMPLAVFATLGALAMVLGTRLLRRQIAGEQPMAPRDLVVNLREFEFVSPLSLRVASRAEVQVWQAQLLNQARTVRNDIVGQLGMMLPELDLEPATGGTVDVQLCQYDVALWGTAIPAPGDDQEAWWAAFKESVRQALLKAAPRAFNVQDAQKLLDWLAASNATLQKELDRVVPLGRFCEIMQRLISEQVSTRHLKLIVQALIEAGQRERDPEILAEHVRMALNREICSAYADDGLLHAFVLSPDLENVVRDSVRQTTQGSLMVFPPEHADPLLDYLEGRLKTCGHRTPVVVCSQDVRPFVRRLLAQRFFSLPVLSMAEASTGFRLDVLGVLELDSGLQDLAPPDTHESDVDLYKKDFR
jgi:type III secretion protein V